MKCVNCGVEVLPWERPQPMVFGGTTYRVPALCDRCARGNTTRPGSPEALERLVNPKHELDPDEVVKIRGRTLLPWESE